MSVRPWMKWYPGDWRADPLLRACDPISRYVWMEMIGLMHEAEPYGHLVLAGRAMDYATLSRVIGVDQGVVKGAVKELESLGVFNRTDGGVIVSRRMVRDETRRKTLQNNGAKGGNPKLKNQELSGSLDKQAANQEDKPQKPETRNTVDKSTGGEPPDLLKAMFDDGLALLTSAGTPEKQARSLLGKWKKAKGEAEVLVGLADCRAKRIEQPVEWLEKRFKAAQFISKSGYEYRGDLKSILKECERRGDNDTYWAVKTAMKAA